MHTLLITTLTPRHLFASTTAAYVVMYHPKTQKNDFSVLNGLRVLPSYQMAGERVWIITEADRSSTTLLMSREY